MPIVTAMATGEPMGVTPSAPGTVESQRVLPIRAVEILEIQAAHLVGDDIGVFVVDAGRQILKSVVGRDERHFLAGEAGRAVVAAGQPVADAAQVADYRRRSRC